jgi:hypothetical protein
MYRIIKMINTKSAFIINKILPTLNGMSKDEVKEKKLTSLNNLKGAIEEEI